VIDFKAKFLASISVIALDKALEVGYSPVSQIPLSSSKIAPGKTSTTESFKTFVVLNSLNPSGAEVSSFSLI
jgi:hypothetical protein